MLVDVATAYGDGRLTAQRRTIAESAASMPGAFRIEELATAARSRDEAIGIATVYRAVAAMARSGWLERVGERDGSALFARCGAGGRHHHHVVCDRCGRTEATECPLAKPTDDSVAGGFLITRHEVTLYGLCPTCVSATAPRRLT